MDATSRKRKTIGEQGRKNTTKHVKHEVTLADNPETSTNSFAQPTQADYDICNTLAEKEALLMAASTRKRIQARSTKAQYARYQKHWTEWCARKKYINGDTVTREKFLAYCNDLMAPDTIINEDNPHLSVLPIRVKATEDYEGDLPSYETFCFYIKGVRDLYIQQ
ncbi:hypothetical protein BGZ65_008297, partial [Modicella reniformis]